MNATRSFQYHEINQKISQLDGFVPITVDRLKGSPRDHRFKSTIFVISMFDIHIENILRLCFLCSNSVITIMHPNWRQRFKSMKWTIIWFQYTEIIKTSISSSILLAYSFVIIPLPDISYEIKSNWFAYSKKEKVRLQLDGFSSTLIWVF